MAQSSDGSTDQGYFQRYYEENKEEINEKRRERYQNDPDYRARSLEASKRYRERKRKKGRVRVARLRAAKEYRTGDGAKIKLYSVGVFATFIGRSAQSLSHWEKRGIMPDTPFRDTRGYRLFSRGMMEVVKREVGQKRRLYPVDPEMCERIREGWIGLGIPVGAEGDLDEVLEQTKGRKEQRAMAKLKKQQSGE